MIITIGVIVGGVAGFLYWKYVGCGYNDGTVEKKLILE
jgi:hypothetical protein